MGVEVTSVLRQVPWLPNSVPTPELRDHPGKFEASNSYQLLTRASGFVKDERQSLVVHLQKRERTHPVTRYLADL